MTKHALFADIDSAAARAQAFAHLPLIDHPTHDIRSQLRDAELDVLEATMRRDMLSLILEMRERQDVDLNRVRAFIKKIYDETIL